ncbi:Myb family transcription factor PHL8 [Linum grandiflorum]
MDSSSNQNMNLVLSTDAKPRLKWTGDLHSLFIDAVNRLGGPEKATPKSLMRVMGIPGLTLYHLKSHLQKYRLGKSQQSSTTSIETKQEILFDAESQQVQSDGNKKPIKESLQIAHALQVQMEVQRKLHEQIEVQRHLQLRIEAQGKYLQSVLNKAQETLAGYGSSSVGIEIAKAELSKLVSMVNSGCTSSCISDLSETEAGSSSPGRKPVKTALCSVESSLTSAESSDEMEQKNETGTSSNQGKKRRNGKIAEQPMAKRFRSSDEMLITTFDLNSKCENENDIIETGPGTIDLNSNGV